MKTHRALTRLSPLALAILVASFGTLGFIDADVAMSRAAIAPDHVTCTAIPFDLAGIPADIADKVCPVPFAAPAAPSAPVFTVDSTAWRNAYDFGQQLTEASANAPYNARFESTARWNAYAFAQELTEQAANAPFVAQFESTARWNAYAFAQELTEEAANAPYVARFTVVDDSFAWWAAYAFAQELTEQAANAPFVARFAE